MENKQEKNGFSLVEIIVAIGVFIIIIGSVAAIFLSALRAQRRTFAVQDVLSNANSAMEIMSRAITQSTVLTSNGQTSSIQLSGHPRKGDIEYKVEDNILKEEGVPITSDEVKISDLTFDIANVGDDDKQPRVTIYFHIKSKGSKPESIVEMDFQTTVSPRNIED